jgi:hypothetical protein
MANAINKNLAMLDVVQIMNFNRSNAQEKVSRYEGEEKIREKTMKQGETIQSDLMIEGDRFYSNATWKEVAGAQDNTLSGLGVFGQS